MQPLQISDRPSKTRLRAPREPARLELTLELPREPQESPRTQKKRDEELDTPRGIAVIDFYV